MTKEQFDLLDKNSYVKYNIDDLVIEDCVDAKTLLCSERFDFYGILIYIDHKVSGVQDLEYAKNIYFERTRSMTGFRLRENGNECKNSFDSFLEVLDRLIEDFQNNKFDIDRTYVPVDNNYVPLDGAHRVSCAAYFNKKIKVLRFPNKEYQFKGYQYLKKELLPTSIADAMALEAMKWHEDLYVFFLWPQAHLDSQKLQYAVNMIEASTNVLYNTEYKLTYHAVQNLMLQIYGHMDWIGTIDNGFMNLVKKVDEVWATNGLVKVVLLRAPSFEDVLRLKTSIREMYGIGLSSCHSTDTIRESRLALNILLNPNSRHFLEKANPCSYPSSYKIFEKFRYYLLNNNIPADNFIVDSSMVLALYGAREAKDLDFYCLPSTETDIFSSAADIEEHDATQKSYYEMPIKDYIINPENYFVFNEVKIISLENLLLFKKHRFKEKKDPKDARDIALIHKILTKRSFLLRWITTAKYNTLRRKRIIHDYFYALFFWRRREILTKIGLYKPLKAIKTFLRGR